MVQSLCKLIFWSLGAVCHDQESHLFYRTANSPKKYRTHLEVPAVKAQRGLFNDRNPKSTFAQPTPVAKKKKSTIIKAVVSSLVGRRQVKYNFASSVRICHFNSKFRFSLQSVRGKKRKSRNSSKCSSINQSKKKIPSAESSVLDYGDFQVSHRKQ